MQTHWGFCESSYEGRIVQKLIQNDGGSGDYQEVPQPFLKVWDLLQNGKADATWVFMGWEVRWLCLTSVHSPSHSRGRRHHGGVFIRQRLVVTV